MSSLILGESLLTREDFQLLSGRHQKDAQSLLEKNGPEGAVYFAGYAVECALKACIAKHMREGHFPPRRKFVEDCYVHDIAKLFQTAELWTLFTDAQKLNPGLNASWQLVKIWNEQKRYDVQTVSQDEAEAFFKAVVDPTDGVLTWIRSHW